MNITDLLVSFENKRVLVVGDIIVDCETNLERIRDDDTGKPTYRTILDSRGKADHYSIGGAGLVVRNLLELGAKVDFISAVGYGKGALFVQSWSQRNLIKHFIQVKKPQTVKHRFKCNGEKVLQVDTMDNSELGSPHSATSAFILMADCDAAVVADYRHGLIDEWCAKDIVHSAAFDRKPIYVSSQVAQSGSNHHWYEGKNTTMVLNQNESHQRWTESRGVKEIINTLGKDGSWRAWPFDGMIVEPAIKIEAVDSCGAGDAFLAAYCLTNDLQFANTWAGLSCTVVGANPPTLQMLRDWYAKDATPAPKYEDMAFCG